MRDFVRAAVRRSVCFFGPHRMNVVALPSSPIADWDTVELTSRHEPLLQAFFEASPLYFEAIHGEPARSGEAHEEICGELPADWPFAKKWVIGYLDKGDSLVAMANAIADLLAVGVWHVGTLIIATSRHGTGDAQTIYSSLESWAMVGGARWMRLGVVAGYSRAEHFWEGRGFMQVRSREGVVMGKKTNTIRVMVKPLYGQPLVEYFELVRRDRPEHTHAD